jgi:hypothetical protein
LLKTTVLSALLALLLGAAAGAAPDDLLVGSVRDGSGAPVSGAEVRAFGAGGGAVGTARVESDGTFAVVLRSAPQFVEVRCRHCRTERLPVAGSSNLVVIVQRYAALESDVPSPPDLAALPYGRIVDDLALMPFVVPGPGDQDVSDRSLAGGRGLILDNGVPLVDLATGSSALVDFPDRYVQSISVVGPEEAFRYGSYAGGGIFALGPASDPAPYAALDSGAAPAFAVEPSIASLHPAYGESNDDGILARRADLGLTTDFAGGVLDASVGSAGERFTSDLDIDEFSRSADLLHVGYATSSRRYRSFVDFSAGDVSLFDDLAQQDEYRSSYLSAGVRLEHPGPVTVSLGALTTRQTAFALADAPLTGRSYDETSYVEAQTGTEHDGAYAGLGLSDVTVLETLRGGPTDGARLALVPSFGGQVPLGSSGAYARAGYSEALRVPTLFESETQLLPAQSGAPLERDELEQSALGFDDGGRVRAEAIAYREDIHGFDERRQFGLGASLVWQVAPLVSLRAWTLCASPQDFYETYYGLPAQAQTSRQVGWASYANGSGLRFDAIAHRDIGLGTTGIELDGDAYVPLTRSAALDLGTAHTSGKRHFYLGLRTR